LVARKYKTPGRIGEYGGRLVGIKSENRSKAILANLISSLSQNIINLGLGLIMALVFFNTYMEIQQGVFLSLVFASTLLVGLLFVRYSVYLGQYVLLIFFFGVTDQLIPAMLGVSTLFFLQSNLPLPPALSVLARGEMAIFLWSVFTSNVLGIVAATFSLWIINLVIPSILGAAIISQADLFDE